MNKILLIIALVFIVGCEEKTKEDIINDTNQVKEVQRNDLWYRKKCIENVVYIAQYRSLTVYIDKDTLKPVTCFYKK